MNTRHFTIKTMMIAALVAIFGMVPPQGAQARDSLSAVRSDLTDLQVQFDNLLLLASRQASAFVFVTSTPHNGDLGGIAGADLICNNLAADAGLPGEYHAWLATSEADDPVSDPDFFHAPGAYILPSGAVVATSFADLTDGTALAHKIDEDETGSPVDAFVWTNVAFDGNVKQIFSASNSSCNSWTLDVNVADIVGHRGHTTLDSGSGRQWTDRTIAFCGVSAHLYCFGQ